MVGECVEASYFLYFEDETNKRVCIVCKQSKVKIHDANEFFMHLI